VAHTHPPEPFGLLHFHGDRYDAFISAATRLSPMLDASNEGLIYLNVAGQWFAFSSHHGNSKSLQDRPSHPISRTQSAFKRFR
jgi:hypothetical protein